MGQYGRSDQHDREIMISMDRMVRWNDTGSRTGMIRHENLGLVDRVNKNATLGRVNEPNRSMLDPERITPGRRPASGSPLGDAPGPP
ncbi:hypothetical protein F2Q69_00022579 [Brassica cretica]|uniref:Uncharacterized protein n=1 Tax=Brassica cretica TaxID=69181 RepID=A0A8S9QHN6_BRACR|nr:hypothetical protein F2Q69_00022579 [Brassica cretica]